MIGVVLTGMLNDGTSGLEQMAATLEESDQPEDAASFRAQAERTRRRARQLHEFAYAQEALSEEVRFRPLEDA